MKSQIPRNFFTTVVIILNVMPGPWSGYPYNRMHGPSSTLHSNVLEMCKWALINMNLKLIRYQNLRFFRFFAKLHPEFLSARN